MAKKIWAYKHKRQGGGMWKLIAGVALMAEVLAGCSMTLPVKGQIQNSEETFSGAATGYMDGAGTLEMVSSLGAVCKGKFVYISSRQGQGVVTGDDRRSGPFEFVSTGWGGTGTGDISGQRLIFTFGD